MNLARFPRRRYTQGKTPLEKLERLSSTLGGPAIYIKRDDMLGLTAGGNKTRKLELLVADALAQGADTLITCGAVQSNHCRLTLSAAVKEGLRCCLVLKELTPGSYQENAGGNVFLFRLLGADQIKVVSAQADMAQEMESMANIVRKNGGKSYIIPMGGSNPIGATGYAACAQEILEQAYELGVDFKAIVCPSASAGTHAGLLAGLLCTNSSIPVIGVNVLRTNPAQAEAVLTLTEDTVKHLNIATEIPASAVVCLDQYLGPGYTQPTSQMTEAVKLTAKTEGILLDPVYSGKAMAGLIDLVRNRYFDNTDHVLFLHTCGAPTLYHWADVLWQNWD